MNAIGILKPLLEAQSGGYPLEQLVVVHNDHNEPIVGAFFADEELDVFFVHYDIERSIIIKADHLAHITTTPVQLQKIENLFDEAQSLNDEIFGFFDRNTEKWVGYEHLLTVPSKSAE